MKKLFLTVLLIMLVTSLAGLENINQIFQSQHSAVGIVSSGDTLYWYNGTDLHAIFSPPPQGGEPQIITGLVPEGAVTQYSESLFSNPTFTGTVSGIDTSMVAGLDSYVTQNSSDYNDTDVEAYLSGTDGIGFSSGVISVGNAGTLKTILSLDNVTNESKSTMFTNPTFTGTVTGVNYGDLDTTGISTTNISLFNNNANFQTDTQVANSLAEFTGTSSITTLGTITSGAWQGTAIADAQIASASTWNSNNYFDSDDAKTAITGSTTWNSSAWEGANWTTAAELNAWGGSANITTLGTITSGTWQGTAIADAQIASASTWNSNNYFDSDDAKTAITGSTTWNSSAWEGANWTTESEVKTITGMSAYQEGVTIADSLDTIADNAYTPIIVVSTASETITETRAIILVDYEGSCSLTIKTPNTGDIGYFQVKDISGGLITNDRTITITAQNSSGVDTQIDGTTGITLDVDYEAVSMVHYNNNFYLLN